ncbi:hypothetical protein XANCAGTX0491_004767 [Xanthoria calcicola]
MQFRPPSWRTSEEPEDHRQRSTVVGMYPEQLNVNRPEIRARVTVKKEHDQDADGHSSTLQASNPRSRALPSTPSSSIDVVKKEDTNDHHSSPFSPGTTTQIHQPGVQQSPYEQKKAMIKAVVASVVKQSTEDGSPEVGQTFNVLLEQTAGNPVLLDLFAAVCSRNASAKDLKDFKVFLRYSKKLLDHERKNRDEFFAQEPAEIGAELARLDARLTQMEEETETRGKREGSNETSSDTTGHLAPGFAQLAELWQLLANLEKSVATLKKENDSNETVGDLLQARIKFNEASTHGQDDGSGSESGTEFPPSNRPRTRPTRPQARNKSNEAKTHGEDDGSGSDSGTEFPPLKKPRLHMNADDDDGSVKGEEAESSSDGPTPSFPPFKVLLRSGRRS